MAPPLHRSHRRWPFWLLLAAWVCANSPQAAIYATLSWLAEAPSFAHQRQLTWDVAHLLSGEKPPERFATLAKRPLQEPLRNSVPIPEEAVLRKLHLAGEKTGELPSPLLAAGKYANATTSMRDRWRAPPLLGPPRSA